MDDFYCEKVFSGKVKIKKVKETDRILAFHHTKPSYDLHIVIVPKQHYPTLFEAPDDLIAEIFSIAKDIIKELKLDEQNYRIITNGGSSQDSHHLHFHLISGEKIE